ncbi:FecR domain-containing protein [Thiocapsa sp. C4-3m]
MTVLEEARMNIKVSLGILALCSAALWNQARADTACDSEAGRLVSVQGAVEVQSATGGEWREASLEGRLCRGDSIRVGMRSRAAIALINNAVLRIDENTTMRLLDVTGVDSEQSWLDLVEGAIMSFSRKPKLLKVSTPYLNGSIEGTEFLARVQDNASQITVFEGRVVTSNAEGSLSVSGGETAIAAKGKAPQPRTLVRPRDAVQWSLYYPPIVALGGSRNGADTSSLREAADLLSVGRVEEARTIVERAIADSSDAGLAFALRAVIKVTQNDRTSALTDAEQAVSLTDAAAAKIALSYAQQADFRIEAARDTLRTAVEQHPDDALARARLAELELMLGRRSEALADAQAAGAMAPDLARTQLVLGFNALASFRNREAKAAFEHAIRLDSADPLGHLGLGLAKISSGELADGGRDLEAAVALDSNNALLRAYLGKVYFEERRNPLDAQQFDIAKELDPLDPTAYLYGGILKQTINRPVEAVADLERSVELNDNRAVYRSRLLLDKDRAARGTSLARAYNDLGFKQLGLNQATRSLVFDPANASAHRFLSDTYVGTRRTEIARVSEMLQAQLLQDVNINPVQPSLTGTNLNIVTLGGPAQPGFNEFTPLFERNTTQLNATVLGGGNETYGGETVVSGVYDRFSFSAGGMAYETDGWRPNNRIDQTLMNFYAQWAVTDVLNVQMEYQQRRSTEGDLAFNFDPEDFLLDKTWERDQSTTRLGLRFSPTQHSTVLLSYIHNDNDESLDQSDSIDPFTLFSIDTDIKDRGNQYEGQYIYKSDLLNLIVGGAYGTTDRTIRDDVAFSDPIFGPFLTFAETTEQTIEHPRGYVYTNLPTMADRLFWTLGLSYDDYSEGVLEETSVNPKLGVQWAVTEDFLLRAAAFKTVKPLLVNNRTLEPTQVAGFNQFFDDVNGTESWRYGLGLDWRIFPGLSTGIELTRRDLNEPVLVLFEELPRADIEVRNEELHRLYLYWTPSERYGVTGEVVYDEYRAEDGVGTLFADLPERVRTLRVPLGVTYFDPSGFFAGIQLTYVDQDVRRSELALGATGTDQFFLLDLAVGYRFPKRYGIASVGVKNLFGETFYYQDDSFRTFSSEASTGPYIPERVLMAQLTLSF